MEENRGVQWLFLIGLCVVVLCACRDHILRGILSFLSIPFYVILLGDHGYVFQWKQRGVGTAFVFTRFYQKYRFQWVRFTTNGIPIFLFYFDINLSWSGIFLTVRIRQERLSTLRRELEPLVSG